MADERIGNSVLIYPSLFVFLTVAYGIATSPSSLDSSRPTPTKTEHELVDGLGIKARLWEDPLENLYQQKFPPRNIDILLNKVKEFKKQGTILLLPVMIPGDPYPEEVEKRHRTRYAVHSALSIAGYTPENAKRIPYYSITHSEDLKIPFEWFTKKIEKASTTEESNNIQLKHDKVIVFWIDEDILKKNAIKQDLWLNTLLKDKIDPSFTINTLFFLLSGVANNSDIRVIGPTGSNGLKNIIDTETLLLFKDKLCFYSPWATVPNETLEIISKKPFTPVLNEDNSCSKRTTITRFQFQTENEKIIVYRN